MHKLLRVSRGATKYLAVSLPAPVPQRQLVCHFVRTRLGKASTLASVDPVLRFTCDTILTFATPVTFRLRSAITIQCKDLLTECP